MRRESSPAGSGDHHGAAMAEWNPVLRPREADEYCGCSAKTLERLQVERHPIPQTGNVRQRWGYRLSTLNAFLDLLSPTAAARGASKRGHAPGRGYVAVPGTRHRSSTL